MQQPLGHIELIIGPMFAGKTTELQQRVKRYSHANHRCLVVKFSGDTRYSSDAATNTHDGSTLQRNESSIETIAARTLAELAHSLTPYSVVAIDEGQFFPDIAEAADAMANSGKVVVISALDGTFERRPFGSIAALIPLAESVQKMAAVCKLCFQTAHFSKRTTDHTCIEMIGGKDSYMPLCRRCYNAATLPSCPARQAQQQCTGSSVAQKDFSFAIEALCGFAQGHKLQSLMRLLHCTSAASSNAAARTTRACSDAAAAASVM
jgi:thymidine kinase